MQVQRVGQQGAVENETAELNLRDVSNPDQDIPRQILLQGAQTRLGRIVHPEFADVAVQSSRCSAQVSRKHATIRRSNGGWTITDEHSTNGVLINGKAVEAGKPHALQHGDLVTFGNEESDLIYTFSSKFVAGKKERNEMKQLDRARNSGFLNEEQYRERARVIKDRVSKELVLDPAATPRSTRSVNGISEMWVRQHNIERAFKYVFNWKEKRWDKCLTLLVVEHAPFDQGAMRECFRATDVTKPQGQQQEIVVKRSKEAGEPQLQYFADAEMQALCQYFAENFCTNNPPKPVRFVEASIIEFFERPGKPVFACEPFLSGQYKKHNNNYGYVSPEDRNTPQAFSHFTYYTSGGKYLVCDIQGVSDTSGDYYTDPQVHSREDMGTLFGKGNLGQKGMVRFFHTHECNYICELLGIAGPKKKKVDRGTCPPQLFRSPYELSEDDLKKFRLNKQQCEQLADKFRRLVRDASGGMDKREFVELCKQLGADLNPGQIDHAMRFVDKDGSGKISFQEFVMWWVGETG